MKRKLNITDLWNELNSLKGTITLTICNSFIYPKEVEHFTLNTTVNNQEEIIKSLEYGSDYECTSVIIVQSLSKHEKYVTCVCSKREKIEHDLHYYSVYTKEELLGFGIHFHDVSATCVELHQMEKGERYDVPYEIPSRDIVVKESEKVTNFYYDWKQKGWEIIYETTLFYKNQRYAYTIALFFDHKDFNRTFKNNVLVPDYYDVSLSSPTRYPNEENEYSRAGLSYFEWEWLNWKISKHILKEQIDHVYNQFEHDFRPIYNEYHNLTITHQIDVPQEPDVVNGYWENTIPLNVTYKGNPYTVEVLFLIPVNLSNIEPNPYPILKGGLLNELTIEQMVIMKDLITAYLYEKSLLYVYTDEAEAWRKQ